MTSTEGNSGWADAMNKILVVKKPSKNKTIILSKGKKLSLMKIEKTDDENTTEDQKQNLNNSLRRHEIYMKGRTKPNILDRDKEKRLQKITVKGVVKLFNAVNKHQQSEKGKLDNIGPVTTKKEKIMNSVSKSSFLNYLMGEVKEEQDEPGFKETKMEIKGEEEAEDDETQQAANPTWEVLQSNYGIGVKMKNWDNKPVEQVDVM